MSALGRMLTVEQVAERYATTPRAIHGKTRLRAMPMLKRAGFRHILVPEAWLDDWDSGSDLEIVEKPDGSVLVRPKSNGRAGPD